MPSDYRQNQEAAAGHDTTAMRNQHGAATTYNSHINVEHTEVGPVRVFEDTMQSDLAFLIGQMDSREGAGEPDDTTP